MHMVTPSTPAVSKFLRLPEPRTWSRRPNHPAAAAKEEEEEKEEENPPKKPKAPQGTPAANNATAADDDRPPVHCISRDKHWIYHQLIPCPCFICLDRNIDFGSLSHVCSYLQGPWLQLPVELLDSLLGLNPPGPGHLMLALILTRRFPLHNTPV